MDIQIRFKSRSPRYVLNVVELTCLVHICGMSITLFQRVCIMVMILGDSFLSSEILFKLDLGYTIFFIFLMRPSLYDYKPHAIQLLVSEI